MGPQNTKNPTPALPHLSRRQASALLLGLVGTGLVPACGPVRPPRVALSDGGRPVVTPTADRIDAIPGWPLVTPVRIDGPLPTAESLSLTLADGAEIPARLFWIGARPDPLARATWLPTVDHWVVAPVTDGVIPASRGAWHLVADIPDGAGGQAVRLADRSIPVNWLADPDTLCPLATTPEAWDPWRPAEPDDEPAPDLLAPEWRSPLRRWRARLVAGTLGGDAPPLQGWQLEGDPAPLDALAALTEARWRVGLARLWYADPEVCRALIRRLTLTVEMTAGVRAPAWPVSQPQLDPLLADLLDGAHTGEALTARASAWLASLPRAVAWVADDAAGLLGADAEPLVQMHAATLDAEPGLLWVTGRAGLRVGEPGVAEPGQVADIAAPLGQGEPRTGASAFTVRCADETITLGARQPTDIRPPGASCAPLMADWTLEAWLDSDPRSGAAPAPGWGGAVLIYRDESGLSPSGWSAFVECAAQEAGPDEVSLFFGQRRTPGAVLHLTRAGVLRDDAHPEDDSLLPVADDGQRWSASVPVPAEAIEPGGVLRVGLARRDPRGVRTAWPRRMMPWETEPARGLVKLNTWSGLGDR